MNTYCAKLLHRRLVHPRYNQRQRINIRYDSLGSLSLSNSLPYIKKGENSSFQRIHEHDNISLQLNNKNKSRAVNLTRAFHSRFFSTISTNPTIQPDNTNNAAKSKKKDDDSNIFLDNLGKIFFAVIFSIIFLLVRSSRGTTNRVNLREYLESISLLDPCEIDDLRVANSLFTPYIFRDIMDYVLQHTNNNGKIKYCEFLSLVKYKMKELKGDEFTIQLGHLLDRIVIHKLENDTEENGADLLRLDFLFTLLTLALSCSVEERVDILYEIISKTSHDDSTTAGTISEEGIIQMMKHLQETYQLDNDAQLLDIPEQKYPFQQYKQGNPEELLKEARKEYNEKFGIELTKGSYSEFDALLRSQYICAWGECYGHRRLQKQK